MGFRRQIGFDLCFTGQSPLVADSFSLQFIVCFIRPIVNSAESSHQIIQIVRLTIMDSASVQLRIPNSATANNAAEDSK